MSRTLMLIKPDAIERGLIGTIISIIEKEGFSILAMRMEHFTKDRAKAFYSVHKEKEFFEGLTDYMVSGPVIGLLLEKENAVEELRRIVGKTNPEKAAEGTIRAKFGVTLRKNSVHASDCEKSAVYEIGVFFEGDE